MAPGAELGRKNTCSISVGLRAPPQRQARTTRCSAPGRAGMRPILGK
eukprot:CAMPEP_0204586982 /NCGR_PEP_ID=MMETSP0661-20131031/47805_1 /ASSEMBLY_ACC=CAM_ASM_000606 /TAXON_ID=109239 /ORGANISM="Alexandrium margalefi, Strain AMGDE01CS-322" /LENGTH=46 /DNA_ID= /DNA_START= /DNA_END= /DNA_ORIENTATION=